MDYFGQTVNIAARVQGLADAGDICLTGALNDDDAVPHLLAGAGYSGRAELARLKGVSTQEQVYRYHRSELEQDAFAVDARGDYGMRLPNGGLLTWVGSVSHSPYGRGFLVGGSIGGLADALLPGR